jgi:lipid II:glycine glycyltransferase (peptidoglycan interpeptide bridge formation enzyme)
LPDGFTPSLQTIQPPRTIVLDLSAGEGNLLQRMKQKTRYNIRLAEKKGVSVAASTDLDTFYNLIKLTGQRDSFAVHSLAYYQTAYELFYSSGRCELFIARYQGQPLAALMVFIHQKRAWYFYGASSDQYRELMPNYLAQWQAIRWAMEKGCDEYDLWGVPDAEPEVLEAGFQHRSDGLWGVYRFKRGFGGVLKRSAGPWDRVYQPVAYNLYRAWMRIRRQGSNYS